MEGLCNLHSPSEGCYVQERPNNSIKVLKQRLQGVILDQLKPDQLRWRWSNDGRFTVRSAYEK